MFGGWLRNIGIHCAGGYEAQNPPRGKPFLLLHAFLSLFALSSAGKSESRSRPIVRATSPSRPVRAHESPERHSSVQAKHLNAHFAPSVFNPGPVFPYIMRDGDVQDKAGHGVLC